MVCAMISADCIHNVVITVKSTNVCIPKNRGAGWYFDNKNMGYVLSTYSLAELCTIHGDCKTPSLCRCSTCQVFDHEVVIFLNMIKFGQNLSKLEIGIYEY